MSPETLLPILLLLFLAIPIMQILRQRKQMKTIQQFQESLERGVVVETAGGIHGKILSLSEATVVLEISPGVEMTMARNRIIHAVADPQSAPATMAKDEEER